MLFKNIYINGHCCDLEVRDGIIVQHCAAGMAEEILDSPITDYGGTLWALPALCNMHTHSAMTLLRSTGSGLPLFRWLNEAIFPAEARLSEDDVYAGTLEACHEMRRTGTSTFNDMYFFIQQSINAVAETGMQAAIGLSISNSDFTDTECHGALRQFLDGCEHHLHQLPDTLRLTIAPHSIYAVSGPHLQYLADFAAEHGLPMHIHLAETQKERADCIREHGIPPVLYLDRLGVLQRMGSRLITAHTLWVDEDEIQLLGAHHATAVHNPNSNLKLGSGCNFPYVELRDAGVNVCLGTDGCASSDNLDMVEAMKVMSLLQKGWRHDPSVLPAAEALQVASLNGLRALGFDAAGIAVGHRANLMFVDLTHYAFRHLQPSQTAQLLDRLVYAAHGDAIAATLIGNDFKMSR